MTTFPPEFYKHSFEIFSIVVYIVFLLHCIKYRDRYSLITIFLLGLIYGGIAESYGILAGHFSENGYWIYIPFVPAPLATILGWPVAYYLTISFTEDFTSFYKIEDIILKSLVSGIFAVSLDLTIDPFAVYFKLWEWEETPPMIFNIPAINYFAWFFAVSTFSFMYYYIKKLQINEKWKYTIFFISIPLGLFIAGSLTYGMQVFVQKAFLGG